ncbi:MAG: hypothetical protein JJU37_11720 [Balneolaceae bacterium]|nr:hypothetical protein [Balneolaceae bacterium]
MNQSQTVSAFSLSRVRHLSNRFFLLNQKNWLVGLLGIAGILFTLWLVPVIITSGDTVPAFSALLQGPAIFAYTLGGLAITSRIFHEVHSPNTCYQFLTLPATNFEKFFSAWVVTTVAYTIFAMLSIVLLSFSVETLSALITGNWGGFALFNPISGDVIETIMSYFVYQSIFMFGAIYFRKNNFLKTVLAYIVIVIGLLITFATIMLILGLSYEGEVNFSMHFDGISGLISETLQFIYSVLFTLVMLLLTYLQLKRKQVA